MSSTFDVASATSCSNSGTMNWMKRILITAGILVAAGVLFWFFPLFRVVAVEQTGATHAADVTAAEFVKTFWQEKLAPSFGQAADVQAVVAALRESPDEAGRRFGRSAGLGRAVLYFVRGSGTIVSVDDRGVGVALGNDATTADVLLKTGAVTGNTVRDATGLLAASDYPNSQQFNDISNELNRIVESSVIGKLMQSAEVGRSIEFVGCARVFNPKSDVQPLTVIPLDVQLK